VTGLAPLLVVATIAAPLALALALAAPRTRPLGLRLAPWAALPGLAAALTTPVGGPAGVVSVPSLLLGTRLGIDDTGRVFLLFSSVLWLAAGVFAQRYLAGDPRRVAFFAFFLLAMSGNLGLTMALDAGSFYLLFALMSFASYGLVVHAGDAEARRAGRVYLALVVVGEVCVFTALTMLATAAGSLDAARLAAANAGGVTTALVLVGFGIKAGALPLHVWLPLAHPVAPTPASAVLSGAMIKAGLLGWLRFLPLGEVALPEWGALCVALGLGAAFFGVAAGVTQENPKTALAYSSISQMGVITVGVGVGLAAPAAWPLILPAVLLYAFHHALAKGALFLGVAVAARGGGRAGRLLVGLGLLLPALALAGAPLTSGAVAKTALKSATGALPAPWPAWLGVLLPLAAVGTTLLVARVLVLAWPRGASGGPAPAGIWTPWAALLALVAGAVWWLPGAELAGRAALTPSSVRTASWPVALGAVLALGACVVSRRRASWRLRVPAGDLLVPAERAARWLASSVGRRLRPPHRPERSPPYAAALDRVAEAFARRRPLGARPAGRLRAGVDPGLLFLLVFGVLLVLLRG